MARETLQGWAKRFVADLNVDGEAIPLDRALRRHLPAISRLRADGLTWESIAAAIRQAGGRRRNGLPFTAAQVRADVSRMTRRRSERETSHPRSRFAAGAACPVGIEGAVSKPAHRSLIDPLQARPHAAPASPTSVADDVSDAELMRVRARLTRT